MIGFPRSFSNIFTVIHSPLALSLCIILTPSLCKPVPFLYFFLPITPVHLFVQGMRNFLYLWLVRAIQNNKGYFCCLWLSARVRRQVTIDEDVVYLDVALREFELALI